VSLETLPIEIIPTVQRESSKFLGLVDAKKQILQLYNRHLVNLIADLPPCHQLQERGKSQEEKQKIMKEERERAKKRPTMFLRAR
jgi:hypothetical protein